MTRVKICGITRQQDAELAAELGADALGFIFEPSSPRCVREDFATYLPKWLPLLGPYITRVAVYGPLPEKPLQSSFQAVQGIRTEHPFALPPCVHRISVVRVRDETTLEDIRSSAVGVEAILLDAYRPGAYGGSGQRVDWGFAAEIVGEVPTSVILAGGLTPDNVKDAIERVKPYAVDVSSGVEASPGIKDPVKLRDFIQAVKGK